MSQCWVGSIKVKSVIHSFHRLSTVFKKGVWIEGKNLRVYNTEISISCWRRGVSYEAQEGSALPSHETADAPTALQRNSAGSPRVAHSRFSTSTCTARSMARSPSTLRAGTISE
jgi:hypothetical protein